MAEANKHIPSMAEIDRMKVMDIRRVCKQLNITQAGRKVDLIARVRAAHPANNAVAVPPPAPLAHPVNNAVAVPPPPPLAQPAQQAMPPAQLPVVAEPVNPPSAFTAVNQRLNAVDDNDDLENAGVEATRRPTGSAKKSGRRNLRVLCENRAVHDSPYLSPRSARTEGNGGRDSTEPASRAPAAAEAVSATPYAGDSLSDDDGRVMPPVVSAFRASPELALPPPQPSVLQPLSVDVGAFGIAFDHDPLMLQGLAGSYAAADLGMLPGLSAVAPDALTVDPDHHGSHFYSACCERVAREQTHQCAVCRARCCLACVDYCAGRYACANGVMCRGCAPVRDGGDSWNPPCSRCGAGVCGRSNCANDLTACDACASQFCSVCWDEVKEVHTDPLHRYQAHA